MSGTDGRSSPRSPDILQAPILKSFFDILIPLYDKLVVQNSQYHLSGNVELADWGAVQERARVVEELRIAYPDHRDGKEVAAGTILRIAQLQGNTTFFPTLRTLDLNIPDGRKDPPALFHPPLFLSPTLTSITISHLGEDAAGSLACFLIGNSPGPLVSLVLHSVELSPLLATSISHCRSLEILDLTFRGLLGYASLQAVFSCPLLSKVKLDARNIQYGGSQAVNGITADIAWNIGGQIHLNGQINMIEDVITATADRKMLGLSITLIASHEEQIQHLLQHIAAQQASITNIAISINLENTLPIDASVLSALTSANTFHELRRLEFRGLSFQGLYQHLPQMALHWHHIQHLSFVTPAVRNAAGSINLATLKSVARSCPNLRSLEAPFDSLGTAFDPPGGISDCLLSHKLLRLSFKESPCPYYSHLPIPPETTQRVARYIYALFPDLEVIETHACRKHGHDSWMPVAESYKLFQNFCRREFKELNDMRQLDGTGD